MWRTTSSANKCLSRRIRNSWLSSSSGSGGGVVQELLLRQHQQTPRGRLPVLPTTTTTTTTTFPRRSMGTYRSNRKTSSSNKNNKKKKKKSNLQRREELRGRPPQSQSAAATQSASAAKTVEPKIQARPPGEQGKQEGSSSFESKFPLPDKEKEDELSQLQTQVQELYKAGNYSRGLQVAQQLLEQTISHFGCNIENNNHPAIASSYNNVGLMYKQLGNFDNSRKQYRTAMRIYKNTVGIDHTSYASTLHNLGTLNRTQIHFDTSLSATDRLCLIEESAEYLERAYNIRVSEYGSSQHPLSVASRSSWGATLATQILHYYKRTQGKQQYQSTSTSNIVSNDGWEAAEQHLREALQSAISNPRGPSIATKKKKSKTKKKKGGINTDGGNKNNNNTIETLSAASAAQNLAIFLKSRATTFITVSPPPPSSSSSLDGTNQQQHHQEEEAEKAGDDDSDDGGNDNEVGGNVTADTADADTAASHQQQLLLNEEALQLYRDVLNVRTKLLPSNHPDLYATKHSLAELLESMGDSEAANTIRQEIVDSYDTNADDSNNNLDDATTSATRN